jgi:hypothetical protein
VRKIGNDDMNEMVWGWFASARARKLPLSGTMVQEHTAKWLERWGKLNLGNQPGD